MSNRNFLPGLRSSLVSLALASSLAGVMAACSSDTPTATQVPSTISAQLPETAAPANDSIAFYYDGVKTSITIKDAAILFAALQQNTNDASKIVSFVNNTLKAGPITAADVNALGDPLKPAISDFTGDGVVNINDAAVLFAIASTGLPPTASKVNTFLSGTLKLGVTVTQAQLDSFFSSAPPTPTSPQIQATPATLKIGSGSSQTVTVSLPSQPSGNVTVTATPSTGITVTPATLNFTPTVFSGTVTVASTATPGTTGTVKFSAPGYDDKVVNVTVDQSPNLVVAPASLSIPANGAAPFTVKLASAPTAPVTITVTPSSPDLSTTLNTLTFTGANFNINQTIQVSTTLGAAPGSQSILLDAGSLGQFKLPVTITPTSTTTFFIDPVNGNDLIFPGTAAQPWKTVANALNIAKPTGFKVATAANAGSDVVITILGGVNPENVVAAINTPTLTAGSVTVLQSPSPGTFNLKMAANALTLNKGYKLQDINITTAVNAAANTGAITITDPSAGLTSVNITCNATATAKGACLLVKGSGFHTLKNVKVAFNDGIAGVIGIKGNDANVALNIVGGSVKPTTNTAGVTGILSEGVLTAAGVTVDMSAGGHTKASTGIKFNGSGSSVTGSNITVSNDPAAIGVKANGSNSVVKGNTFTAAGKGIGINGITNLPGFSLTDNTFVGNFTVKAL